MFSMAVFSSVSAASMKASRGYACSIGGGRGYGYSRLLSLRVEQMSCSLGEYLATKSSTRKGWRCTRQLLVRSTTYYEERVTCTYRDSWVLWTYRQNA
jgi:hypothetical protein